MQQNAHETRYAHIHVQHIHTRSTTHTHTYEQLTLLMYYLCTINTTGVVPYDCNGQQEEVVFLHNL